MKIILLFLLLVNVAVGQEIVQMPVLSGDQLHLSEPEIASRWVETVNAPGDTTCRHEFLRLSSDSPFGITYGCLVIHDKRGCPNGWGREELLCEKCGRHIVRSELREFTEAYHARKKSESEYRARVDSAKSRWLGIKPPPPIRIFNIPSRYLRLDTLSIIQSDSITIDWPQPEKLRVDK